MLENTGRNLKLLAGAIGVNLALALAVGAGAVPQMGDGAVRTAAVSGAEEIAGPPARQPGDTEAPAAETPAEAPAQAPTTEAPVTPVPPTTVAKPRTTTPPTTKAPAAPKTSQPAAASAPTAPSAPAPAAATTVARRTPTAGEVQSAIGELKRQVGGLLLLVSPTPAQIDDVGDRVCDAFDAGQTFAQVKTTALSMIPPTVIVTAGTTEWAVRQAVALYCPGHASKLV